MAGENQVRARTYLPVKLLSAKIEWLVVGNEVRRRIKWRIVLHVETILCIAKVLRTVLIFIIMPVASLTNLIA